MDLCKRDVTALVTAYCYIKFLSNGTTDTSHYGFEADYRPHALLLVLPSRCTHSLQFGPIFHDLPTADYNVWSCWRRFHHILCQGQITSVATVKTEAVWNTVFMFRYAPLKSSDDDFHYSVHRPFSSSCFKMQTATFSWIATTAFICCARVT